MCAHGSDHEPQTTRVVRLICTIICERCGSNNVDVDDNDDEATSPVSIMLSWSVTQIRNWDCLDVCIGCVCLIGV